MKFKYHSHCDRSRGQAGRKGQGRGKAPASIKASVHSCKVSNATVFVQGSILCKASHSEKRGAFINLCNQNAS